MKRIAAITLVIVMIFALTVSVAAQDSPIGKEFYRISVSSEGDGEASSSTNKVEVGTDDTVTLTAEPGDGFFTYWIIDGDYEIVSGSLTDPVIVIRPRSDIDATASFSVEEDYLRMLAYAVPEELGDGEVDIPRVKKGTETEVTFTATETGGEFIEWEFFCEYKIVRGDLKSKVITIIPYTDVTGVAYFKKSGAPTEKPTEAPKPDNGKTAPKTADPLPYAIPIMALALGAAIVAVMKLKKD